MHAFCALTPEASISGERPLPRGIDLESKKRRIVAPLSTISRFRTISGQFRDGSKRASLERGSRHTLVLRRVLRKKLNSFSLERERESREVLENGVEGWKSKVDWKFSPRVSAQWPNIIFVFSFFFPKKFSRLLPISRYSFFFFFIKNSLLGKRESNKSNLTPSANSWILIHAPLKEHWTAYVRR